MALEKIIRFCDRWMFVSFCALVYFLPISIFFVEMFSGMALFAYLLKRICVFKKDLDKSQSSDNKLNLFLKSFKPIEAPFNGFLWGWVLICLLSIATSHYQELGLKGFFGKVLQSVFILCNFVECLTTKKRLKIIAIVILISSTLIFTDGIVQHFTGKDFIRKNYTAENRVCASLRQANDFGAYLITLLPTILVLGLFPLMTFVKKKKLSLELSSFFNPLFGFWAFVLFIMGILSLGWTYSRGAWMAFVLAILFVFVRTRKVLIAFLILVGLTSIFFYFQMVQHRTYMMEPGKIFNLTGRIEYWQEAINIIKDRPWLGVGLNAYSEVGKNYKIIWGGYPHNCFLQMAAEIGIVGLGLFLGFIFKFFLHGFKSCAIEKDFFIKNLILASLAGILAFLIQSFFDTTLYSVQLSAFFWLMLGFSYALTRIDKQRL